MSINWSMLFANNSGQDTVNQIFKFNQETEDRKQRDRFQAQNVGLEQRKMQQQEEMAKTDYSQRMAETMLGHQYKVQESAINRQDQFDMYSMQSMQAQQKQGIEQDRWEQDMKQKQEARQSALMSEERKFGMEEQRLQLDQLKAQQEHESRLATAMTNKQNAETQRMSVEANAKIVDAMGPSLAGLPQQPQRRVGLDGSPLYIPLNSTLSLIQQ